jgi:hypothetical protein
MPGISAKSSRIAPSSESRVGRQAVVRPDISSIEVIMGLLLRRLVSIGNHPIAICRARASAVDALAVPTMRSRFRVRVERSATRCDPKPRKIQQAHA